MILPITNDYVCMAIEKAQQPRSRSTVTPDGMTNKGSGKQDGDFILQESPFLYWEGDPINVSELMRGIRTGLRNRYSTSSLPLGLARAIKEVFSAKPLTEE